MSNPIDEYVKRNLANQEITPSKNLFADKIQPRIKQKKAAAFPYLRVAAAILILLAAYATLTLLIDPAEAQYQPQEVSPFVSEEPLELEPTIAIPPLEEEAGTEEVNAGENLPANMIAQEESAQKQPKISPVVDEVVPEQSRTIAMAEATDPTTDPVATETKATKKKSYSIKIKIDPAKYGVSESASSEVASAKPTVGSYARDQYKSIKDGEGIQAPPKELLPLPNLALRIEGNPLKKVLPGKE